ncbi:hypothetical protein ACH9EU_10540 [Kocuria sp. M1R5S2]|uniref:hypothetical protein n=1 Tax=Kocuria rhizosphaerae TaxID=3376285 RepID=UPI0037A6A90C
MGELFSRLPSWTTSMCSATANRVRARVVQSCRRDISFVTVATIDSAAALSRHVPVRPVLGFT